MASEIKVSVNLKISKGYLDHAKAQTISVTMAGEDVLDATQDIGTAYEAVVIPAEVATAGYAYLRNLDSTNYVEIGVEVSAAFYGLLRLKPGEVALCRFTTTAIFARAHTAGVKLEICLAED